MIKAGRTTLESRVGVTLRELRMLHRDVTSGMIFSNLISWAFVADGAFTLVRALDQQRRECYP